MTASVGLGRNHALTAFLLDPDLGILESFAVGATHSALDGLAKGGPRKNARHRYKRSGQYFCSITHKNILLAAKITYQPFLRISARITHTESVWALDPFKQRFPTALSRCRAAQTAESAFLRSGCWDTVSYTHLRAHE